MNNSLGNAGQSARKKAESISKKKKEARISTFGPKFGGFLNAIVGESKSAQAWEKGARGEIAIGELLDALCAEYGYKVMHDRKVPGSSANIDHIFVTNRGIFVIDTKNYKGLVDVKIEGGILSKRQEILTIDGRPQTRLVEGVKKQVALIENAISDSKETIPVFGVLGFYDAEWPLVMRPTAVDGVLLNGKGIKELILSIEIHFEAFPEAIWEKLLKEFESK